MNFLKKFFRTTRPAPALKQARKARPAFDTLEERCTPALYSGYSHVNSSTSLTQYEAVSASSPNGSHVVVWTHQYSTSDYDIRAQRYNSSGAKVGGEITVANSSAREFEPAVCMDGGGWFYVAYTRQTTSSNKDVFVARFNSSGILQGTTTVANSTRNEYDPSIACSRGGSFVVTYTYDYSSSDQDIRAAMYSYAGTLQSSFTVVSSSANDETQSAVARNQSSTNSNFSIAYVVNNRDIYVRRYTGSGSFIGTYSVATTTDTESKPSIAMDYNANTVVAYQRYVGSDWDIYARKIYYNGLMSNTWAVNTSSYQDTDAAVAMDYTDGDFVIAYQQTRGTTNYVMQSEVSTSGSVRSTYAVAYPTGTYYSKPSVSISGLDLFFVAYSLYNGVGDSGYGVFGRRGIL